MKKVIIALITITIIMGIVYATRIFYNNKEKEQEKKSRENIITEVSEEKLLDECTDEYEEIQQVNTKEEKVSPYCSFTINTHYNKCGHTKSEYLNLPNELVNCTESEVKDKYQDYNVTTFASNEIVLDKEESGECGEHYIVKDNDGKIAIYKIEDNGEEGLIEETDISTEYLSEADKVAMHNGLKVNGKQNLNQLIEDYE